MYVYVKIILFLSSCSAFCSQNGKGYIRFGTAEYSTLTFFVGFAHKVTWKASQPNGHR